MGVLIMKREKIGTNELDMLLFQNHYENEDELPEEDDVMPDYKVRPNKVCYFDLKVNGKQHPLTDDILTWQFKMEQAGRYDEIPDNPDDVIKMFESNPNLLRELG